MQDPTYNREVIDANPTWEIAFILSEHLNDNAPLGWGRYIEIAEVVMKDKTIRNVLKTHFTT